jgi:hypothetical protein
MTCLVHLLLLTFSCPTGVRVLVLVVIKEVVKAGLRIFEQIVNFWAGFCFPGMPIKVVKYIWG